MWALLYIPLAVGALQPVEVGRFHNPYYCDGIRIKLAMQVEMLQRSAWVRVECHQLGGPVWEERWRLLRQGA